MNIRRIQPTHPLCPVGYKWLSWVWVAKVCLGPFSHPRPLAGHCHHGARMFMGVESVADVPVGLIG